MLGLKVRRTLLPCTKHMQPASRNCSKPFCTGQLRYIGRSCTRQNWVDLSAQWLGRDSVQSPSCMLSTTVPTALPPPQPQPLYGPFPEPSGWACARRDLLDFMVQGEINRGRYTDHLTGRHSVQINQCPPPPSPHVFTGWMPFLLPNQQCQSTEGN